MEPACDEYVLDICDSTAHWMARHRPWDASLDTTELLNTARELRLALTNLLQHQEEMLEDTITRLLRVRGQLTSYIVTVKAPRAKKSGLRL